MADNTNVPVLKIVKPKPKKVYERIDKENDKYGAVLRFLNKILTNLGKEQIDDITKFIDIDRADILSSVNDTLIVDSKLDLFVHFDKEECGYYHRTKLRNINVLRRVIKRIGYEFISKQVEIVHIVNNLNYRRSHYLYTIK
jgi:hypothetical protein